MTKKKKLPAPLSTDLFAWKKRLIRYFRAKLSDVLPRATKMPQSLTLESGKTGKAVTFEMETMVLNAEGELLYATYEAKGVPCEVRIDNE